MNKESEIQTPPGVFFLFYLCFSPIGFLPRNYVTNKWIVPPLHLPQGGSKPPCPASLFQTMRKDSYWPDLGHVLQSVLLDVFTHISSLQ